MFINFNMTKILFMFLMIISTLFSLSSISFMNMWMGMEVNLISFIPLMMNKLNNLSSESMMKYFLIQSISSVNFLFSSIYLIFLNKWFNYLNNLIYLLIIMILNMSLLMKMGAAPLHFWFPKTMKNLTWTNCFLLSTWQKIIPMIILFYSYLKLLIFFFVFFSVIMGSLMGLNQTSLILLISYSSINHIGWMLMSLIINLNLWIIYFLIYMFINFILMMMFNKIKIFNLNQIFYNKMNLINYFILLNLLSLGGLPPFLGFLSKWMIINYLINEHMYMICMTLILTSLISLFFYIRITYSYMMINFNEMKFFSYKMEKSKILILMNFLSISSLILISLFFF
uniref:NADH-ubiquinone oxidoreductase chain 2 n=1 Tax=Brachycentrus kozlovi TaxID=2566358 RepID=A0A9E8RUN8_9NEOP|nr:NADH dehydrogenase subunit 2 [Brachycentrus kozlovi]UZZ43805.1 NADH dehydrogenase subunit 2 [Brachycentrus kozlovi]